MNLDNPALNQVTLRLLRCLDILLNLHIYYIYTYMISDIYYIQLYIYIYTHYI